MGARAREHGAAEDTREGRTVKTDRDPGLGIASRAGFVRDPKPSRRPASAPGRGGRRGEAARRAPGGARGFSRPGSIRYRRGVSKKLSRAKRKDLRDKGSIEAAPRAAAERRSAARRDEEASAASRVQEAREEIAAEEEAREAAPRPRARRDRTVLVLVGLTALAALIFWLTQRTPSKDTKIDVPTPSVPGTGSARP